jgi:hypothetical protein
MSELSTFITTASELLKQNEALMNELKALKLEVRTIKFCYPRGYIALKELAIYYGVSAPTLTKKPWYLPFFGARAINEGGSSSKKWLLKDVEEWDLNAVEKHKADWEALTLTERKALMSA